MTVLDPDHAVTTLVWHETPVDGIDCDIDRLPIPTDERSVLWRLAWTQTTNPAPLQRVLAHCAP